MAHMLLWGLVIASAATVAMAAAPAGPAHPVVLTPAQRDAVLQALAKNRAGTEAWLKSDITSYLATVDRRDFESRTTLSVGRAAGNDVRVDAPAFTAHHLTVTVDGDRFIVRAVDAAARFSVKGADTREAVVDPGAIGVGRFQLRLSHQRYPAIIVFDPKSPGFARYKGLRYFPPNLALRFELPLTPNATPETVTILSTRGNARRAAKIGWFDVLVDGRPVRLQAVRLLEPGVGEHDLSVFFRDATSGQESYALGRYIDATPLPDGRYLLDFNSAYNPACAFSEHYNCPIPQRENILAVPIRAGEMDAHYH